MDGVLGLTTVLALVVVAGIVFAGARTVPQGQVWMLERLGAFSRELHAGRHVLIPFIDRIGTRMNVLQQVLDIPEQRATTRDNATVTVEGAIHFQVVAPAKAAYQVLDLQQALAARAATSIGTVIGETALESALSSRADIAAQVLALLEEATEGWGVKLSRAEIRHIRPR